MTDVAVAPIAALEGPDGLAAPKLRKGERTRQRLLETAIDKFGRHGFRGASVSEIAATCGLTQAATYAYFDSKVALFRAAVDADASALIDEADAQVLGLPVRLVAPAFIAHTVANLDAHPLTRRVIAGQEPEAITQLVGLPALEALTVRFAESLREGQATGEVRADIDPDALARGIQTICLALVMSSVQTGAAADNAVVGVLQALDAMLRPMG